MTVKIDTTARIEKIRVQPQGAFPAGDPESGYGWLYFITGSANGGMYFENDTGMRIGPFVTGSAGSGSGGSLAYINTFTVNTGTSINLTSVITSTYNDYLFMFHNLCPSTSGSNIQLLASTDNGSNWDSGNNYSWAISRYGTGGSWGDSADTGGNARIVQDVNTGVSGFYCSGFLKLFYPLSATTYKSFNGQFFQRGSDGKTYQNTCGGVYKSTTAMNAVQFLFSAGNITGTIVAYGYKLS